MKKFTLLLSFLVLPLLSYGQVSVVSNYTQDFNSLGTALPAGWGVWTDSTATGNGTAFTWSTSEVSNNGGANSSTYFRNLPGSSQTWSAGLSSGTDRALGWRAGNAPSRDGSITFTLSNTTNWTFNSLSFDIFTPNDAGSSSTFNLEYQTGAAGTFTQLGSASYTNDTPQAALIVTSITLNSAQLSVLNNNASQVTLRLVNTGTSGSTWNSIAIDNFTYSAVPEPSTYALLLGAAMLGFCVYRRRTKQVV